MSDFASRLRRIREAKGITPYRLSQLTGLSKQGVINLEAESADPKLSTIYKLAEALEVEPRDLLAGRDGASTPVGHQGRGASELYDRLEPLLDELTGMGQMNEARLTPWLVRNLVTRFWRVCDDITGESRQESDPVRSKKTGYGGKR
jgi:transcriptional regulator with XRE-family HTH domain